MIKAYYLAPLLVWLFLLGRGAPLHAQAPVKLKIGANLTVSDPGGWRMIQKGLDSRKLTLERSEPNYQVELKLARFEPKAFAPRILHGRDFHFNGASSKTFVEKSGAVTAINANYFDEKGRPLAYLKTAEKEINRFVSKHALYTGIFGLRDGVPFVLHRDEFNPSQASEALQSGPLLLHRGAPMEVMRGLGRYARRAVVGIDKDGKLIVAVTDAVLGGLSFAELQELFTNPKLQLDTPDLLNLDGGGSAQLYVKSGKFEEWVVGTTEVPVAIGFFAKAN
ncbi:MAG: phosphodiester glycosidase family protein [Deltaproteobacteria bacterium]|nr:phosphodiester glycosidase family protein [Deltaproteobacteria bacterium]